MAADIAEFGVKIKAPEGVEQSVSAFKKIEDASKGSSRAVDSHTGSFEKLAATMAKNTSGASMLLRQLGGLGGAGAELAERLERVALQGERMTANAAKQLSSQDVLNKAYRDGAIAAATIESAQLRLNAARMAAANVERAYAAAVEANAAKQAAVRSAQAATGLAQVGVTSERQYLIDAQARMAATVSLKEYEVAEMAAARASANLAAEQRLLSAAVASQKIALVEAKEANAALTTITQERAAANAELAASEKLVNAAGAATGIGVSGTIGIIAGLVAILIVLAATFETVKKAWELFRDSIKAGADEQKAEFPFQQMVGNVTLAEEKLKQFHEFANSQGSFDFPGLVSAAQQMIVLGTGADNLVPRVKQLASLAAASGQSLDAMTQAYGRTEQAIINRTELMVRGMNGSRIILLALMADLGKSQDKVQEMFKKGEISIQMVNKALEDAAKSGGAFGKTLTDYLRTLPGAMGQLANVWEQVKTEFGKPIASALAEVVSLITKDVRGLIPLAREAGEEVAHIIRAFALIAQEQGWANAISAAWDIMITKMVDFTVTMLVTAFTNLGPALADALLAGFMAKLTAPGIGDVIAKHLASGSTAGLISDLQGVTKDRIFNESEMRAFGVTLINDIMGGAREKLPELQKMLSDAMARTQIPVGVDASVTIGGKSSLGGLQPGDSPLNAIPKAGKESDWEKYKTDLQIINEYWTEIDTINSKVADETERERRIFELTNKTAKELYNPTQFNPYLGKLGEVMVAEAERERKQKEIDIAIKNGTASWTEAMQRGLEKAKNAFGNWAQAVEKATTDIANALANDISTGLTDILDGTKSASQGFRDMAVSILKDIEKIIIRMLVVKAIEASIGAFGGGGGGTGGGGMAGGGPITGGSGHSDDVPILAMGGEFMIRKDVTRSEGIDKLAMLNEGKATIVRKYGAGGEIEPPILPVPPTGNYPGVGGNYPHWNDIDQARRSGDIPASSGGIRNTDVGNYSASRRLFADDSYSPRSYAPGREFPGDYGPNAQPTPTPGNDIYGPNNQGVGPYAGPFNARDTGTFFGPYQPGNNVYGPNNVGTGPFLGPFASRDTGTTFGPVAPGSIIIGANAAGTYNSTYGTWDTIVGTNVIRTPVTPPSSFGPGMVAAGLTVTGFDANTGTTFYRDSSGKTYAAGPSSPRESQPGGATQSGTGTGTPVTPYSNFGGVTSGTRSTIGNAAFDSHAAGLMEMAFQSFGGNPNNTGTTTDAGHTIYYPNAGTPMGHAENGVVTPTGGTFGSGQRDPRWVYPSQSESARLGLSFVQNAGKYNDWLIAHNQWYYGNASATGPEIPHFHTGGIVGEDGFMRMAAGGPVTSDQLINAQKGEGVFTRGQMAAIGSGMSGPSAVHIAINVDSHDNVTSSNSDASMSDEDWKRLAKLIEGMTVSTLEKQRRFRGAAYRSRAG